MLVDQRAKMPMQQCPVTDVTQIAGFYAQMTGVLAGFAFTAMVVLLSPIQVDERAEVGRKDEQVLAALFAAFIALVVTTLNYSLLAGEPADASQRAHSMRLIDGVPFGMAAVMLFQGITLLLNAGRMGRLLVGTGRAFTVVIGPALAYYYLVNGTSDIETLRAAGGSEHVCEPQAAALLGQILNVVLVAVLAASTVRRLQPSRGRDLARRLSNMPAVVVLATTVIAAMVSGYVGTRPPEFLLPAAMVNLYLVAVFAVLVLVGLTIALSAPDQPADSPFSVVAARGRTTRWRRRARRWPLPRG
ncbi:hypothetical protein EDC02_5660 [Micromonospora sp. Llam0]|uniref:hypothetical protein n=1 Tax=Micromonospora sp. Llam0 TaxID=2485143 RepID=UPI000F48650E|nr:hypothetical protein [Micromonospora sp. Llam0]ROO50802.1 hypothetical protein EDC02_5660 [Micromonospora sp. Llam0]